MKSIQASASSNDELRCGAKTRAGKPCEAHPMKNGRCRMHGGLSTGAPRGNTNRMTHGFYSNVILPQERALLERARDVTIDDDIALMQVILHAWVQASGNSDVARFPQHADLIIKAVEAIRKLRMTKFAVDGGNAHPSSFDDDDLTITMD